ncbi:ABC transporter ATP-binding protein [Pectobacterium polonicum]|uniref:ABC-type dipeptide transporter n=1 Tax=Pectobacterium polonicum TaxID=2485124 RepID=A0ABV1PG56_9GAMM|nr:ABC transporter ATP-binding protein [Pectobacterium polonicum]MDC9820514.1 ABC transporter ATP-binding protein [Pectobacterium polonicum]GKW25741.1 ABC transporter ATP-binding protein [Pectobacterium carotovorum subsp. carotovorum]
MNTNTSPLVLVNALSIWNRNSALVKSISFQIGQERVALVGESGSGKSLTARSLMGLLATGLHSQATTLQVLGEDTLSFDEKRWNTLRGKRVAMVMQDPKYALNPARTLGWQVEEPLRHQKLSRAERQEKVCDMLAAVGLPHPQTLRHAYPHQLSGGMGQRVMLAIALITEPQLLIADEPTSALDYELRNQVLGLIQRMVEERNMGLLLISHDLQHVAECCERVMVMYKGSLLDGLPASELHRATHPYTRTLWNCRPGKETYGQALPTLDRTLLEAFDSHD